MGAWLRAWCGVRMWVVPLVVLGCVTLPHLDQGDWMRTDSAWYAAIGVQGWRTGALWTLTAEPGVAYFNKPPLVFWIHGLAMHFWGTGALQARLPTVFAAGLCLAAIVGLCRVSRGHGGWGISRHGAATVGVVLALTIEFFRRTREISLDMWQAAFMLLAAWAVVAGVSRKQPVWIVLSGVPVGLALLVKPFMALLALMLLAVWMIWISQARLLIWIGAAVGVALVVASPWHLSMWMQHGEVFTSQYFGAEVADRAAGKLNATPDTAKPWWFYLDEILLEYWPWCVALVLACVSWLRGHRLTRQGSLERWALVWAVGWLVALSLFPDRRERYALPVWPALAVLSGLWIARWPWHWLRGVQRWFLSWGWGVLAAGAVVFALLPVRVQKPVDPQWPALLSWMEEQPEANLWVAGRQTERMARLYLEQGRWPGATHDRWMHQVGWPRPGDRILYHIPDGVLAGANEREVFRSGNLVLTVLEGGDWKPSWP